MSAAAQNGAASNAAPPGLGSGAGASQQHPSGSSSSPAPMVMKAKDEIFTSLHLIKDIRRLETYQRDFFLKVTK